MAESALTSRRLTLVLVAATAVVFARVPFGSFHFDDYLLLQDPAITAQWGLGGFWKPYTTRPLTWFSFWLNYQLSGNDPFTWHLTGVLLHLICIVLLYTCLRQMIPAAPAFAAAALFGVHPVQVEAVAWVFSRSTLLCAFFCLLTLRAWLAGRWWLATCLFALALLAKEECVFFPFFLLLFPRSGKPVPRTPLLTMVALSAAAGARVVLATRMLPGTGAGFTANISPAEYALAQGVVIWRYARLIFFPVGLTFDPDLHPAWSGVIGWLALLALIMFGLRSRRMGAAGRWLTGGIIILLASSSIFPANDLAADRRLYLPLIALAPAIALALHSFRVPRWVSIACAVAAAGLAFARTGVWQSELTLWKDAVEKAPTKLRPRIQLARALPPQAALTELAEAASLHPVSALVPAERGRIHIQANQPELAIADFGQAAALDPTNPQMWNNLGGAYALLGQSAAAERAFRRALKADPCYADARRNLGLKLCSP